MNGNKSTASHQFTPASGHLLRGRGAFYAEARLVDDCKEFYYMGDYHIIIRIHVGVSEF